MNTKTIVTDFEVGIDDHVLHLYTGDKGRELFNEVVLENLPEGEIWEDSGDADGLQFENHLYLDDLSDLRTLLHEFQHYLDKLFLMLSCTEETEFKAYLMSNILEKVLVFREKCMTPPTAKTFAMYP